MNKNYDFHALADVVLCRGLGIILNSPSVEWRLIVSTLHANLQGVMNLWGFVYYNV